MNSTPSPSPGTLAATIMRHPTFFLAVIFCLFSCGDRVKEKNVSADISHKQSDSIHAINKIKEIWTIYFHKEPIFHVKRLIVQGGHLNLLSYEINTIDPESATQKLVENKFISNLAEADKIKSENRKYNWTPYKTSRQTLFIQIEAAAFKDEMTALLKRQAVEQEIENALKLNNNGEWTAGDIGPGGANMLFEVADIDNAIPIILGILSKEALDKKTIIGRRLDTSKEDWFYEVIYPLNFDGQFLTM